MGLESFKTEASNKDTSFNGNQHTEGLNYNNEEIKNAVQELADELGRTPSATEAKKHEDIPGPKSISERFGSWNSLLKEVGLELNEVREYDDSEKENIKKDIKRVNDMVNENITIRKYKKLGDYSEGTIIKFFNSWNSALKACNLSINSKHGNQTTCKCGKILDSNIEKTVGDILHEKNLKHQVHKRIPSSDFISDFYLPNYDLWIEVDGYWKYTRPQHSRKSEKQETYQDNELDVLWLNVEDEFANKIKTEIE